MGRKGENRKHAKRQYELIKVGHFLKIRFYKSFICFSSINNDLFFFLNSGNYDCVMLRSFSWNQEDNNGCELEKNQYYFKNDCNSIFPILWNSFEMLLMNWFYFKVYCLDRINDLTVSKFSKTRRLRLFPKLHTLP